VTRHELLYQVTPRALPERSLLVTVTAPGPLAPEAASDLDAFLSLLAGLYRSLGGAGLEVRRIREATFDAPRLSLGAPGEAKDVPLEQFVEVFTRWIAEERAAREE